MTRRARRRLRVLVNRVARQVTQGDPEGRRAERALGWSLIASERRATWGMVQCCAGCRAFLRRAS